MWANCSGALIPNLLAPDSSGIEAAEGTVAHGVGELWAKTGKKPRHLLGTTETVNGFVIEITHEMMDQVQRYVDWCWTLTGTHFVEQRVHYDFITPIPNQGGTMDHAACEWQKLVVTDLKYGKGYQVFAENNIQLYLYAIGFFFEWDWLYDFQEITMRICQPRMEHFDEWTVTRAELLAMVDWLRVRAHAAWVLDAPRTPGPKQCQWCKVKATCGAYVTWYDSLTDGCYHDLTEVSQERIDETMDNIALMQPFKKFKPAAELSTADLSVLYQYKGMVDSWWNAMSEELKKRVARGENAPLQKIVEGRVRRVYRDQDKAISYFVDELDIPRSKIVEEKLASPAEMEKVLRAAGHSRSEIPNLLERVVVKPRGKPSLVGLSDKRRALVDIDEDVYRDLTNPETDETETED